MRVGYGESTTEHPDVEVDLDVDQVESGWLPLMRHWLEDAIEAEVPEPNAMTLGTVDGNGHPRTRTVLCKGLSEDGVLFFTNYESDKGRQIAAHPHASVTFAWTPIARQVSVRGRVVRAPASATQAYWRTRPRGSQLGAWASQQSQPVTSRGDLDAALVREAKKYGPDTDIPVPPHWGGFLIRPDVVEFWQGRANRMHNRIRTSDVDGTRVVERLQP
ncbi:pyridoxamine 5'-phosphate oxidase [Rhodococcus sp. NPDC058521]|uniref:pyridoxamine 5'-phosphate oxidase n=1 Tax=Rhodococcus sp. NPDC058521 TaxID=3346536 RepID=UPI00365BE4F2